MLPLLLLLAPAADADTVRATLRLDGDRAVLVHATRVPGEAGSVDGPVAVLDAAGRVVATAALPPLARHRSVLLPDGAQTAEVASPYVRVVLPWPDGARALRVGPTTLDLPDARLARAADVGAVAPVLEGGPSDRRLDLVFLSEGFTAEREAAFDEAVDAVVDHLLTVEPYGAYAGLLNVWRGFVPSVGAGIDDPVRGKVVDTPFGCAYGCDLGATATDRLICCDEGAVTDAVDALAPFADGVMLLVDDTKYGGSGGLVYSVAFTGGPDAVEVATHELGHTLIGLWDEYSYGMPSDPELRYRSPNCGALDDDVPWPGWLDGVPIAWPLWHAVDALRNELGEDARVACDARPGALDPDAICAFEGCSFTDFVRPTRSSCKMSTLGQPYCPVCREAIVEALYRGAGDGLVVDADPPEHAVVRVGPGETRPFVVDAVGPDGGLYWTWSLDGEVVHEGPDYVLDSDTRTCGTLTLSLLDPTLWVRDDPDGRLADEATWEVRAGPCCGCASPGTAAVSSPLFLALLALRRRRPCRTSP